MRELAEWRLKRVQLESRQGQRRAVPREAWPEVMNDRKLQSLRQDLFRREQELASIQSILAEGKKLLAPRQVPSGSATDESPDVAWSPSIKVYVKRRDIAQLKVNYEMDLIEANLELELLRAIEQELILEERVKEMMRKRASSR